MKQRMLSGMTLLLLVSVTLSGCRSNGAEIAAKNSQDNGPALTTKTKTGQAGKTVLPEKAKESAKAASSDAAQLQAGVSSSVVTTSSSESESVYVPSERVINNAREQIEAAGIKGDFSDADLSKMLQYQYGRDESIVDIAQMSRSTWEQGQLKGAGDSGN